MGNTVNRRDFLKTGFTTAGIIGLMPGASAMRHISPSDRLDMAFCGIGNRGGQILNDFMNTGMVNPVVFCDTDMGAPHTLKALEAYPGVPRFRDFRKMFDKMSANFDAVCIGTPDFAHFPIAMLAMSMGKHVYVEKPLSRTFMESELMMRAAERYGVVTQMGNQGHSEANYFQFKTWVEHGIIKDVREVTAHMNNRRRWHGWDSRMTSFPAAQPLPETLDWDTWLGTARYHDYHEDLVNGQWRCWYDFGMGALGDWGAHIIDTVHEFLELGLPVEVEPLKLEGHNPLFYPQASTLAFRFPEKGDRPAMTITWYDGLDNQPDLPEGYGQSELAENIPAASNGMIQAAKLNPGKIIYGGDLTFKGGSHGSTLSIVPAEAALDMASSLPDVPESPSNHFENFVKACRGEEKSRSPFLVAAPLSQVFVLGTLAQRLNTKIVFDRERKRVVNNELADLLLSPLPRIGWEEFYKL
ncbi:MAG: oxidoreductase [Bacteroidetes bacterium]|nr:MAG: oxidoreductase [Bacteroidota bacterium]